jgi:hypothetical protein
MVIYWQRRKDTLNAIANYKKALAIQYAEETKQKINKLEGKEVFTLTPQQLQHMQVNMKLKIFLLLLHSLVKDNALHGNRFRDRMTRSFYRGTEYIYCEKTKRL